MNAGSDVLGPFPLSFVEQFAFGFFDTVILGTLPANALGTADFPLFCQTRRRCAGSTCRWHRGRRARCS